MRLTLHETGREKTNDILAAGEVYTYCVGGMPPGENANIALFDGSWRTLRWNDEWHGNWTGEYASPEDALAGLQEEINLTMA